MRRTVQLLLCTLLWAATGCDAAEAEHGLVIGAAASLSALLPELVDAYAEASGTTPATTTGSSGQLAHQIRQGAPIDVLLAADVEWVDALIADGYVLPASRAVYARGRLALWSRDSAFAVTELADLAGAGNGRIAIANPEFAPYGRAAREALTAAGAWDALEPRIVIAENVRQALQFAETGNVDATLIAHTLVRNARGRTLPVPDSLHAPLDQALGIVAAGDTAAARGFVAFVLGPAGRALLTRHGFTVPDAP